MRWVSSARGLAGPVILASVIGSWVLMTPTGWALV
jgi:hypothetical protein